MFCYTYIFKMKCIMFKLNSSTNSRILEPILVPSLLDITVRMRRRWQAAGSNVILIFNPTRNS